MTSMNAFVIVNLIAILVFGVVHGVVIYGCWRRSSLLLLSLVILASIAGFFGLLRIDFGEIKPGFFGYVGPGGVPGVIRRTFGFLCGSIWVCVLYGLYLLVTARRPRQGQREEPRCRKCGYLLRGLPEPRCPECGTPFSYRLFDSSRKDQG